jgi:hypothetical protein
MQNGHTNSQSTRLIAGTMAAHRRPTGKTPRVKKAADGKSHSAGATMATTALE